MTFSDAEIFEQVIQGFGLHGRAVVGVQGQGGGNDVPGRAGLGDELTGQITGFVIGNHPARDESAEEIDGDIGVVKQVFGGIAQLGDVPAPDLMNRFGHQHRFGVVRMLALSAPFAHQRSRTRSSTFKIRYIELGLHR